MPRYARQKSEKQSYHIMMRGNNREKIFIDEDDKSRIIDILGDKKKSEEYSLYAFCVMDNHIHLIIKEGKDPTARIVKRIAASYSYYFNKKYKRIGHVFQERYRSENIENERYLLSVIRYVHRNPVKAGIGTIEGYRWSSYRDYTEKKSSMTDIADILGMISNDHGKALVEFERFNRELTEESFLDIAEEKDINHDNAAGYIKRYLAEKGLEINDLKSSANKEIRNELIETLRENSDISLRTIAAILDLNRETVRKSQCQ